MQDGIVASLREVTKAFMCFAMNVNGSTINAALCRESVLYIYVASVEKEKKIFFICHVWRKHFFISSILLRFNDMASITIKKT